LFKKKLLNCYLVGALVTFSPTVASSSTVSIPASTIKLASEFSSGDVANFTGNGTINVDADKTLDSITTTTSGNGIINFTTANTLTISNGIGSSSNSLSGAAFTADGTLTVGSDLYLSSGITTATTNQGNLTLSGSTSQTISGAIGSSSLSINTLLINQSSGVVFSKAVYANNLSTTSNSGTLFITANDSLYFSNSSFNVGTNISGSSTLNLGAVTLASAKTLTLNLDSTLSSLSSGDSSSTISVASGKTLTINGNITGSGILKGASSGVGNLSFTGTTAQTVSSTYQIGDSSNRLDTIYVSNLSGVTFRNDAYATSLNFNQSSGASSLSIASGKTLDISENISNNSTSATSTITGSGGLSLTGTSAQTVDASLGSGTSDRLGGLTISNTAGVTLNEDAYITTLTTSAATTIAANGVLNASSSAINQNTTISGSGTVNLGAVTLASAKTITLNLDSTFSSLSSGDSSSTISIASGKTLTLTGNITGSGILEGATSGVGNLSFSGTSAQSVSSTYQIGDSSNRLGTIYVSNTSGVTFNNDAYATSLNFNQSSSSSTLTVASGKTLDVSGNISTSSNSATSIITGSGTLSLSGTSAQTVDASLGSGTSNRLGELEINNSSGVTLNNDNYLTTLTLTSGNLTIAGDTTTDVTNAIDLSSKNITFQVGSSSNPFAKIKSAAGITLDSSTAINIDYSTNTAALNYDDSTQYIIAESGSGIAGTISDVTVTDNSYLFNSSLSVSGSNIVTKLVSDTSTFSSANLGSSNYQIVSNALNYAGLSSGLISISNSSQLSNAIQSLKPMNNSAQLTSVISSNSNIIKIVSSHSREDRAKEQKLSSSVWGRVFGSSVNQQERQNTVGYKENSGGIIFGSDHSVSDNSVVGVAAGYNRANISGDTTYQNKIGIDSYQLVLYNSNSAKSNLGFYNDNAANLTLNRYTTNREIQVGTFTSNSNASFNSTSQAIRIGFGYNAKNQYDYFIDPNFGVEYFRIGQNSYQETGAENASLKVKTQGVSGYFSDVGVKVSKKFELDQYFLTPKFSANWRRALKDYSQKSTISFVGGGSAINNDSIATQRNILNLGSAISIDQGGDDSLQLQFDLRLADKLVGNTFWAKYIFLF